jgi:hypothetical protein
VPIRVGDYQSRAILLVIVTVIVIVIAIAITEFY